MSLSPLGSTEVSSERLLSRPLQTALSLLLNKLLPLLANFFGFLLRLSQSSLASTHCR